MTPLVRANFPPAEVPQPTVHRAWIEGSEQNRSI
jgi:hypothetical protein